MRASLRNSTFLQFSTMVPGILLLPFLAKSENQQWLITLWISQLLDVYYRTLFC